MPIPLWPISSGRTSGSSRSGCALPTTPARHGGYTSSPRAKSSATHSAKGIAGRRGPGLHTRLLPADRDGERLIDDRDGFGQRRTGTTVFTNVAVSNDEVLSDTPYDAAPEAATRLLGLGGGSAQRRD